MNSDASSVLKEIIFIYNLCVAKNSRKINANNSDNKFWYVKYAKNTNYMVLLA